jgi:hypothetical protein
MEGRQAYYTCSYRCNPKGLAHRPERLLHLKGCKLFRKRTKGKKSNRAVPGTRGSKAGSHRKKG